MEVTGPNRDLHPVYGGGVANLIQVLSEMIADERRNQHITIPGFYGKCLSFQTERRLNRTILRP